MAKSGEKVSLRKGPWTPEEDQKLIAYINRYGIWNWKEMAKPAGLQRSGKSCRLRWMNYLKPGLKHGNFTREEDETIIELRGKHGNRWSMIASRLPGRTDNEIKNYWHSHLSKRLKQNPVPKKEAVEISKVELETQQKSSSGVDLSPVFVPKASSSDSSGAILLSLQFSTDGLPSSSSNPAAEIDKNQITNCSSETFRELQSTLEQQPLLTAEGSNIADQNYGAIDAEPVWFQQYQGNSCNDVWLNYLTKGMMYGQSS